MTIAKLNPWNWFKKENEQEQNLPVTQTGEMAQRTPSPLDQFHAEFDRMVDSVFSGFGLPSPGRMHQWPGSGLSKAAIKPSVDVYGTDNEYVIEVDLPGVDEKDLSVELRDDMLVLSAHKQHEEKTEDKGYYRVERSYGSFRRVLNVPKDADRDNINAKLDKGVLCITMPRTKVVEGNARKIAVESTSAQ